MQIILSDYPEYLNGWGTILGVTDSEEERYSCIFRNYALATEIAKRLGWGIIDNWVTPSNKSKDVPSVQKVVLKQGKSMPSPRRPSVPVTTIYTPLDNGQNLGLVFSLNHQTAIDIAKAMNWEITPEK